MLLRKKIKIAQSVGELEKQASAFLKKYGFTDDPAHRKIFASFIQGAPQDHDYFYPGLLARCMRKARANEAAFYLMHPERWEKLQKELKEENDAKAAASASSEVVQKG